MRAATLCTPNVSRATLAAMLLELSPLLTAAQASARSTPAWVSTARSKPIPVTRSPLNPEPSLRNASGSLSMTETALSRSSRLWASVDPPRPQPMITMCTAVPSTNERVPDPGTSRPRYALRWHPPPPGVEDATSRWKEERELRSARSRPYRAHGRNGLAVPFRGRAWEQPVPGHSNALVSTTDILGEVKRRSLRPDAGITSPHSWWNTGLVRSSS